MKSGLHRTVAGTLQLERPGVPGGVDCADSPCCANRSLASPAGHYVSIKWVNRIDQTKREMLAVFYSLLFFFFSFSFARRQSLAVLQQPPPQPEGVLLPAAAPPEDY